MNYSFTLFIATVLSLFIYRILILERSKLTLGSKEKSFFFKFFKDEKIVQSFMRVLISLLVVSLSFYIILSGRFDADNQKWAFGSVGTVIGFWLKP